MRKLLLFLNFVIISALFGCVALLNGVFAWTEPAGAPPLNNVAAPVNVSADAQVKTGGLGLLGENPATQYGLSTASGTLGAIKTKNASTASEVSVNQSTRGVYIDSAKASYSGIYSVMNGANSYGAYYYNKNNTGTGFYTRTSGLGGAIFSDTFGLNITADNTGVNSVSKKEAVIAKLKDVNNNQIAEAKLSFLNSLNKPVAVGGYKDANNYGELGQEGVGLKAKGSQYAGVFEGNVYVNGTLSVKSGCNGCADLAESISRAERVVAGDIVAVDSRLRLIRATKNSQTVVGVVSTKPSLNLNDNIELNGAPLALSGIVPVNVTNENGAIRAGDFITASSVSGYGMKATSGGTVVGKALEDLKSERGQVKMLVAVSWFGGESCACKK